MTNLDIDQMHVINKTIRVLLGYVPVDLRNYVYKSEKYVKLKRDFDELNQYIQCTWLTKDSFCRIYEDC